MLTSELLEVLTLQRAHLQRFHGDSTRRPRRRIVEQSLLAEALAGAKHGERDDITERRGDPNRHPATLDHIELVARLTLVEQRLALAVGASHHRLEHRATIDVGQSAQWAVLHALTIDAIHGFQDRAPKISKLSPR